MYKVFTYMKNILIYTIFSSMMLSDIYATSINENDGAAFITKAEFDALKSSFQSQIDTYNQSIDSKIDSAIASYLSGIKIETISTAYTGINYNGYGNVVKFLGKSYSGLNHKNEPYGYDDLKVTAVKAYRNTYAAYRETYHYYIYQAYNKVGNTTNFVMQKDSNNRVLNQRKNYLIKYLRNIITYSSNVANYGGGWISLNANIAFPTAESTTTLTDTISGTHVGFNMNTSGGSRGKGTPYPFPGQLIVIEATDADFMGLNIPLNSKFAWSYLTNGTDQPATATYTPTPDNYNPIASVFNFVTRNGAFSYAGTADSNVYHWPKGATDKIYCVDNDFDSMANAEKASPSQFTYTRSVKFNNMPGLNADNYKHLVTIINGGNKVVGEDKGYGIKIKTTQKNPNEIYYNNTYSVWGIESPMGNGFNFYYGSSKGELEFKLKGSAANTKLYFKTTGYASSDDSGTTNMIEYEIKQGTGSFTKTKKFNMAANVEYTIKIPYEKNTQLKLFAIPNADNGSVDITQIGQAIFTNKG